MHILRKLSLPAVIRRAAAVAEFPVRLPSRLASLEERLRALCSQLDTLCDQMAENQQWAKDTNRTLDAVLQQQRALLMRQRIDVVDNGGFLLFMFKDDLAYATIPQEHRHQAATLVGRPPPRPENNQVADVQDYIGRWTLSSSVTDRLLAQFVKTWDKFTVIDVGCQYGTSAMSLARFINSFGSRNDVFAFDCGLAGELAGYNISLNGYQSQVHFYPYAVSSHDGFFRMSWQVGHSEDNHIARPQPADPAFSRPVQGVALDSFAARMGITGPLFVKIDTQGVEDAVLHGMQDLLRQQVVGGVVEFTPWTYRNRGVDLGFIRELMRTHVLFDIGRFQHGFPCEPEKAAALSPLAAEELEAFANSVDHSPGRWTDLMFVPKNMPGLSEFLSAIGAKMPDASADLSAAA